MLLMRPKAHQCDSDGHLLARLARNRLGQAALDLPGFPRTARPTIFPAAGPYGIYMGSLRFYAGQNMEADMTAILHSPITAVICLVLFNAWVAMLCAIFWPRKSDPAALRRHRGDARRAMSASGHSTPLSNQKVR
jgi:hypothetical protein